MFHQVIPSGKHTKNYGKSQFFNGKINYTWPFSIAMLNYQRVDGFRKSVWMIFTHPRFFFHEMKGFSVRLFIQTRGLKYTFQIVLSMPVYTLSMDLTRPIHSI